MGSGEIYARKMEKLIEKENFEQRRDQVLAVKGIISSVSGDNVNLINREIDNCSQILVSGVKGIDSLNLLISSLSEKKERAGTMDVYLNSYESKLDYELGDCSRKISDLESEISRLESEYQQALADEERARREELEKAMRLNGLLGI